MDAGTLAARTRAVLARDGVKSKASERRQRYRQRAKEIMQLAKQGDEETIARLLEAGDALRKE